MNIEHFLGDIRGLRYLHLKKVHFFVGHPVVSRRRDLALADFSDPLQ